MFYYKFRVNFDDVEDFVRDIEILASDNFENFHKILYTSIGLKGNELASFSLCDVKWNKQKEITLIDMGDDSVAAMPEYDENDDFTTKSNLPKFVMKDSVLKDFISDPHQHIIYEYDFLNPKIFYVELLKILPVKEDVKYPRCSYSLKELPKETPNLHIPNPEDDFVEEVEDYDDDFQEGLNEEDQIDLTNIEDFGSNF
jgi:hypothetical protein